MSRPSLTAGGLTVGGLTPGAPAGPSGGMR
jgi:hypothetical protein